MGLTPVGMRVSVGGHILWGMRYSVARLGIWSRLIGIAFVFTFVDDEIYQILDLVFPNLDGNLETNIGRGLYALAVLAMMLEFAPEGRKFLGLPRVSVRGGTVVGFSFLIFLFPGFMHGHLPTESVGRFFDVLLFSMMIGVSEELLCRGFIFQLFNRIGFWAAVNFSAIGFGLMHFYNLSAGQNVTYTIYQAIDAALFGYFALGLMIFTGSIWVPVLFHGLYNLPVITIDNLGRGDISFGWFDALAAATHGAALVGLGLGMIWARVGWPGFMVRVQDFVKAMVIKMKLVE